MASVTLLAGILFVQSTTPVVTVEGDVQRIDVGYAEMIEGNPAAAIARIEGNRDLESDDPAALINLGAAHARLGHLQTAQQYYLAAIASPARCDLELADGRWMDSRRAARLGYEGLARGEILAVR